MNISPCPRTLLAAVAGWLALCSGTSAQTVATPPRVESENTKTGEVVELPPFQVQADDNTGWTPSQTLAGTRFRANLADLAVNGQKVPDTSVIQHGKAETAFDFSFGYSGKSKWLGDRKYSLGLNIRNAFPTDDYVPRNRDFFTGASLVTVRAIPRQFILTCEIDL